ncbi:unnamed protein product [Paramecium sonneborni]|uniref:Uncharacterized protein n=1 Tax=Paramecium sonneborni TaxID=65129 RepID=A0A8S1PIX4_9CILI|nr:unnamed protein product [Paramecium sonneborni]
MWRCFMIIILLTISQNCSIQKFKYCQKQIKLKALIRGNYKNVIRFDEGPLLASRKQNLFLGVGRLIGILFRNEIYEIYSNYRGTYCQIGQSIVIELIQVFELNTLLIMLRNGDIRTYDFIIYASDSNKETVIFDSVIYYIEVAKIKFPNQLVKYFRIFNRNGNSEAPFLHIIKAEAYFQL